MSVIEAGWQGFIEEPNSCFDFRGGDAFEKLLKDYTFESILDIGSGDGQHTLEFKKYGKEDADFKQKRLKYFEKV